MPNKSNIESVAKIVDEIKEASALWIVDYRGLTVKETETLRRAVRAVGGHVSVHKNTLVKLALKETEQPAIDEFLAGPSAFVFAGADAVAAAKAVKDFVKGGVMDGKACFAADVEAIASLPSREQLMGQLAGLISGMARGLAVSIGGVSRGLAVVTSAVAEQKPAA